MMMVLVFLVVMLVMLMFGHIGGSYIALTNRIDVPAKLKANCH